MELLHIFGIMNRNAITGDTVEILVSVIELTDIDEAAVNAAKQAPSTEADQALAVWDQLIDVYYSQPTKTLLESLCTSYGTLSADDYTKDSFSAFSQALESGRLVLGNASAHQSAIDSATAELSYTGRSLVKNTATDHGDVIDTNPQTLPGNFESVKNLVVITSIILAVAAAVLMTAAVIKLIKRKQKLIYIIGGYLFLPHAQKPAVPFIHLCFYGFRLIILFVISALEIGYLLVIVGVRHIQIVHLMLKTSLCPLHLL